MTPLREAVVLPLLFLTVVFLGGIRPGAVSQFVPPGLFALVLAVLLAGSLVRSGALAPQLLVGVTRGPLANANGLTVIASGYLAAAQVLTLVTPTAGLPQFFVSVFLFVLLLNTWVSLPDRVHVLRSLMVILGAAFVLKFVVLASLSDPSGGRIRRVLVVLVDAASLGGITQERQPPAAGYVAFAAIVLFMIALAILPHPRGSSDYESGKLRSLSPEPRVPAVNQTRRDS
jgi:hypothetical protein